LDTQKPTLVGAVHTKLDFESYRSQKLNRYKPETLGHASRLSGITPATISLLMIHLKKTKFKGFVAGRDPLSDQPVAAAGQPSAKVDAP